MPLRWNNLLSDNTESFKYQDLRYTLLLNTTMGDIISALHEITLTQIQALNLINNIHRPKDLSMKRSLLPFGYLFNFFFGTAKDNDIRSMKQDIKRLYDN